jgi:hypothetical protein
MDPLCLQMGVYGLLAHLAVCGAAVSQSEATCPGLLGLETTPGMRSTGSVLTEKTSQEFSRPCDTRNKPPFKGV